MEISGILHLHDADGKTRFIISGDSIRGMATAIKARLVDVHHLSKGDVVGLDCVSPSIFVPFLGACMNLGVTLAPINSQLPDNHNYLKRVGAKAVFRESFKEVKGYPNVHMSKKKGSFTILMDGTDLVPDATPLPLQSSDSEGDAFILSTSGTTGQPKLVHLTQVNLLQGVSNIISAFDLTPSDSSILVLPLFHIHGIIAGCLAPMFSGGTLHVADKPKFSPTGFWDIAGHYTITWYTAVPTIHALVVQERMQPYPLRFVRSSSAALSEEVSGSMSAIFQCPILQAYSMTENTHQMTCGTIACPNSGHTVGKPYNTEVSVRDDDFKEVPVGTNGNIWIKSPSLTRGYMNNEEANEEAFRDGYFKTGDLGHMSNGELVISGRIKEMINRGGEKITPGDIDLSLLKIKEVHEAVAFGVPNTLYGEAVHAVVTTRCDTTPEHITNELTARLPSFMVPTVIYINREIPKTPIGKISRAHIRDVPQFTNGASYLGCLLYMVGVRTIFGVPGVPITDVANRFFEFGGEYVGMRNEISAAYAAASHFVGNPGCQPSSVGVCLTVGGPGFLAALNGAVHAGLHALPMVVLSGSNDQVVNGFQAMDQMSPAGLAFKKTFRVTCAEEAEQILLESFKCALEVPMGAVYIDLPSGMLLSKIPISLQWNLHPARPFKEPPREPEFSKVDEAKKNEIVNILVNSKRPVVMFGEGALSYHRYEPDLLENNLEIVRHTLLSVILAIGLGRSVVADIETQAPVRTLCLSQCDVVFLIGTDPGWQLSKIKNKDGKNKKIVVLHSGNISDNPDVCVSMQGDVPTIANSILTALKERLEVEEGGEGVVYKRAPWVECVSEALVERLESKIPAGDVLKQAANMSDKIGYDAIMDGINVLANTYRKAGKKVHFVAEGANTMDYARRKISVLEGENWIDAGRWGTMGSGYPAAISMALQHKESVVFAIMGDSAFGFSGMELDTIKRFDLPIATFVLDNGGIYGAHERVSSQRPFQSSKHPCSISGDYSAMAESFGISQKSVTAPWIMEKLCLEADVQRLPLPILVSIKMNPLDGPNVGAMMKAHVV